MSPEMIELLQMIGGFTLILIAILSIRIILAILGIIFMAIVGTGSVIVVIGIILTLMYFGLHHFI